MIINLTEIYKGLEAWRSSRHISAESQREGYIINIMEELGELSQALRGLEFENTRKVAQNEIIDALCDIAVFTINAWDEQEPKKYISTFRTDTIAFKTTATNFLLVNCAYLNFEDVLITCASICEQYGYNFEVAMLETIKEISSRTGTYDENAKKWVKDISPQAKSKWYKADYERAKIK